MKGKDEEEGEDKGGEDKPVVNPLEDKEPVLNPPEPVPVRLDSQPLESASSQGSAEGQEDKAAGQQGKAEGQEDKAGGQEGKAEGQDDKADENKVIIALCFHNVQYGSCAVLVNPVNLNAGNVMPALEISTQIFQGQFKRVSTLRSCFRLTTVELYFLFWS